MKKVLLIGELSDIARSLNECLIDDFSVQLCSVQLDNVQALVKIVKPDIIIICQIGAEETDNEIFHWIGRNCSEIPVIGIATDEGWKQCRDYFGSDGFEVMFRPVSKSELLERCHKLLGGKRGHTGKREEIKGRGQKKKIMIVDDSALVLRSMKSMLEAGYDICLAKSGEQALNLIPKEKPDLLLLDYEMEGMDGRCTFEAMREDEDMKVIPVIFLTSVANQKAIYSVLKSKPDGYILKPPDKDKIMEKIEEVLDRLKF